MYDSMNKKVYIRRDVIFDEKLDGGSLHTVIESRGRMNQIGEIESSDEIFEEKKKWKNPRLPIPRDPYPKRSTRASSKNDSGEKDLIIAEAMLNEVEFQSLEEVLDSDEADHWMEAINDELRSLEEKDTWVLVPRTKEQHVITNRWIFRHKFKANGEIDRYKARLVIRGCSQKHGIDYEETFAPVVKYNSIRTLLAVSAAKNFKMYQFDVKTAFLHGELEEEIYMEQPCGFAEDDKVCLLKKSLYGLKQAPRQCNKKIVNFLCNFGLTQSRSDP